MAYSQDTMSGSLISRIGKPALQRTNVIWLVLISRIALLLAFTLQILNIRRNKLTYYFTSVITLPYQRYKQSLGLYLCVSVDKKVHLYRRACRFAFSSNTLAELDEFRPKSLRKSVRPFRLLLISVFFTRTVV
jgi:hypothetical protein